MSKIKITPFGGVHENGKNMYAVEVDEQIFILDCGLKYPENELMGIDVVVPDWSFLKDSADRIVGAMPMQLVGCRISWLILTYRYLGAN